MNKESVKKKLKDSTNFQGRMKAKIIINFKRIKVNKSPRLKKHKIKVLKEKNKKINQNKRKIK